MAGGCDENAENVEFLFTYINDREILATLGEVVFKFFSRDESIAVCVNSFNLVHNVVEFHLAVRSE